MATKAAAVEPYFATNYTHFRAQDAGRRGKRRRSPARHGTGPAVSNLDDIEGGRVVAVGWLGEAKPDRLLRLLDAVKLPLRTDGAVEDGLVLAVVIEIG